MQVYRVDVGEVTGDGRLLLLCFPTNFLGRGLFLLVHGCIFISKKENKPSIARPLLMSYKSSWFLISLLFQIFLIQTSDKTALGSISSFTVVLFRTSNISSIISKLKVLQEIVI